MQDDHPKAGELVSAARGMVDELFDFIKTRAIIRLPVEERPIVAAAPAYDLGLASMHTSPPLEPRPVAELLLHHRGRLHWPPERQLAWLRMFNYATLADITAHEVAPGHDEHSLFMRHTTGRIRRIWVGLQPFPQPSIRPGRMGTLCRADGQRRGIQVG